MNAQSPIKVGDNERSTTFVIRIGSRHGLEVARPTRAPAVAVGESQSVSAEESAEWSDSSGRVVATVWPRPAVRDIRQGLHFTAGFPVRVEDRFIGHFARVDFDASGRGTVRQDPYGLHPLYFGHVQGVTLLANRPNLIAAEVERITGETAARDRRLAAWLAFSGYPIGSRTGFEAVRCIPFGATAHVDPGSGVKFISVCPPWLTAEVVDIDSRVDCIESELIANLRAAIGAMGHVPRLQLTGGRDSRLILALAVRGDLLQDIELVTLGKSEAPDAQVAKALATRLGIPHVSGDWNDGIVDRRRLCPHVRLVAGAVGCVDSSISLSTDGRMTLSGFAGETLRTNWPRRTGYCEVQSVIDGFVSMPYGRTGILQRDIHDTALKDGIRSLLAPIEGGARCEDLFDAYYIQHRVRRWLSSRPERLMDEFLPLYYPPATELAFAIGWRDRSAGRIHDTIIDRAGRAVSEPAYYKPGGFYRPEKIWSTSRNSWKRRIASYTYGVVSRGLRQQSSRPDQIISADNVSRHEALITKIVNGIRSTRSRLTGKGSEPRSQILVRRQAAYRELILARDDNPAFDVFDRERLLEAVDILHELDESSAGEVHGAMTGVIWLGRLEGECPGTDP